jgi:pyruvate/2-oxoglutarate dehydrogenase complex dihydrolipoamide dehydrogenase (E3) component
MATKYDAIVVGTGQAGPSLAVRLAETGMKVAIIERKRFGGTCVNNGCIPTKTLVASARAAHVARRAGDYGVTIRSPIAVDMKKVKARKDAVVRQSSEGVENWLRNTKNLTVIEGQARFSDAHQVRVAEEVLEAHKFFINVGGRAAVPEFRGIDQVSYLNNSTMMDVDFLPEHLVVIGGSYVGLEFAQMYRRFGSEVTVVERGPRLIHREDEDVSENIKTILEGEGITIRLGAECIGFEKRGDKAAVQVDCTSGDKTVIGSHALLAVGRVPNTSDLGLEQAGIKVDKRGYIQVDDQLRTSVPGIYALGDCNGRGAFTHTAYNDYEIVAANLLDGDERRVSYRITAYALYIDPPLGRAGMLKRKCESQDAKL